MQTTSQATVLTEAKTSVRWKIFLMMLFLIAINYIDRASLSVAMPLIAKEFDLSPTMQGLILSSFFWTYALMQVPGGMLADKYKPRIVIACATVFWGLAQTVAAFTTNAMSLMLTRLGLRPEDVTEGTIEARGKVDGEVIEPRQVFFRSAVHFVVVVDVYNDVQLVRQGLIDRPVHALGELRVQSVRSVALSVRGPPHRQPDRREPGLLDRWEELGLEGYPPGAFLRSLKGVA